MRPSLDASQVEVRPAGPADLKAIATLADRTWRACYPGIITIEQIDYMLARHYDLDVMAQELADGICYDGVEVDGVLRGFSSYGPADTVEETKLHKLYVDPEWQGAGLAGRLMDRLREVTLRWHRPVVFLQVNKNNTTALRAYEKYGFTRRESVVVDIGDGFVMDDYILEKRLS